MSGLEIVGAVLGAFPIAIEALKAVQEVTRCLRIFHEIRPEYTKCKHKLKFYQASFKSHLRQLLRPLVEKDDVMNDLLSNPGGSGWQEKETTDLLQQRLGEEMQQLLIDCIEGINDVLGKLNRELIPNSTLEEYLGKRKSWTFESRLKDSIQPQLYRIRFSIGETTRNRLFEELERYDSQFTRLLSMIDDETQNIQTRMPTISQPPGSAVLCNIWAHANTLFKALSTAWTCCCHDRHLAELLLQHRTTDKNEFNMLFAKQSPSSWHIQKALITAGVEPHSQESSMSSSVNIKATVHQPYHRTSIPIRSALKRGDTISVPPMPTHKKPVTACASISAASQANIGLPISSLCRSLNSDVDGCYGYLTEEDNRYYVCRISRQETEKFDSVTIDHILRGEVLPSRRQRYALSLTLASSFLQLLDTPWLPASWRKSDIVFINDEKSPSMFLLDQPYLKREFTISSRSKSSQQQQPLMIGDIPINGDNIRRYESFELIGIVLLELCFGQLLEEHPVRKQWPAGDNELEKYKFDVVAARQWANEVNEEAGTDFDEAIRWCFEGCRNIPPENWRQEMFQHVVHPLDNCRMYLSR
ncbi:uncharacterized protein F4807DRAFT_448951 [Annulohypoxylon truncatum]|uniref:uncharacterized protein n=1 Tax=Annulohypoxylon truncatum TaxID=327061 RepID=UPI002007A2C7|nr:uncharacterized protein F4807DRAFT_448951 [Annulohypoxylon truncatum]KAI1204104.1 hypothetical protein F4807DRAFT_448951 [Annulohypoxylon truncatum]